MILPNLVLILEPKIILKVDANRKFSKNSINFYLIFAASQPNFNIITENVQLKISVLLTFLATHRSQINNSYLLSEVLMY